MIVKFSVETTPFPQPRPRVARHHAYEPARISEYKRAIQTIASIHMKGLAPFENLVKLELCFRRNKKIGSRSFGDIDNLVKAVLDALNGVCYTDDALIVKLIAVKETDSIEGIDIVLTDDI